MTNPKKIEKQSDKRFYTAKEVLYKLAKDHWEFMNITEDEIRLLTGDSTPTQRRNLSRALAYFKGV
jgi:hypothetical protein